MTPADTSRIKVLLLLAAMQRRVASIKAAIAVLTLCVSVLGITACGGEAQQQQKEVQQAPQKAAGSSGSGAEQGLVGTWEVVDTDQGPDLAGGLWTFSSDGTFQAQPLPEDAPDIVLPAQYRADGSHIYFSDPETGAEMSQTEYTLNGDTLRTHVEVAHPEFPMAQTATFKRKS